MNKNTSHINIGATQISLINIENHENGHFNDPDLKYFQGGINFVESIKRNALDSERPFNVQQGSIACFGLIITHLGEHPSPFWFDKYRRLSISSFKITEGPNSVSHGFNRTDKFDSTVFPEDKCLTNEGDNPFILQLRFIGIHVKCFSLGKPINFELQVSHEASHELSTTDYELSEPFQKFKLTGQMVVNQPLKVDGFIKNNMVFIKLLNEQSNMDVEIEELGVNNIKTMGTMVQLPFVLNPGNQMNISIPLNDEFDENWKERTENIAKIFFKWNLCQNLNEKYTLTSILDMKMEPKPLKEAPISIKCKKFNIRKIYIGSIKEIRDSKVILEIKVRVKRRMELCLRILEEMEYTHHYKLIPLHDFATIGIVDVGEVKSHMLYFYYATEGLHQSPKIEVKDKLSGKAYKIGNKIFSVDPKDLMCIPSGPATSHIIPTFFTKLHNSTTHLDNSYDFKEKTPLQPEGHYNQPGSDFYYGSDPTTADPSHLTQTGDQRKNTNPENLNNDNLVQNQQQLAAQDVTKEELSNEAVMLDNEVKSMKESKDEMDEIEKKEKELSEQLVDTNYQKLTELVKKRNSLVNKISSVAKTLRMEHDAIYPELKGQPIFIVAKNKDDEKRKANQLAHLEGFEDFMHHITSPCNMMEELRQKSDESKKSNFRDKFETEQKILDSMSSMERLNYDKNMIEHYESIMQEIEKGIQKAEEEIDKSWNHVVE
ncbi:hypothetical protein MACJ_001126 [Theileria orientalis]|uniref:Uncharacterized protein n=1 Tax=Theileria orientalis TaxID=68886 RepID=A0A976M804_THEOR|nr:hypothetical protein MACJ_001126 [Theileria orientalis]